MKKYLSVIWNYIKRLDKILLLTCIGLTLFSVLLLYSMVQNEVTTVVTDRNYKMQLYSMLAGVGLALLVAGFDYHFISKLWYLYAPAAIILVLLLFTPLGYGVDGADDLNWLDLGFTAIQPSEFLKIAFIMTFSRHLSKAGEKMNEMPHFLLLCLHGLFPVGLISVQGDDGTALVFLFMFIMMMFVAGLKWRFMLAGMVLAPLAVYFVWNFIMQPHHKIRFLVLMDPELQATSSLYDQQRWSLIAIGSGQMTGKGLFGGEYQFVPAIHTDFIFSYVGMTLGFIGAVAVVGVLLFISLKILYTGITAYDAMGKLICVGVFSLIIFHSIVNIGMALAVVPVIGIPLPFLSGGGSSVLSMFICIGLVLSVHAHKVRQHHMFYTEKPD